MVKAQTCHHGADVSGRSPDHDCIRSLPCSLQPAATRTCSQEVDNISVDEVVKIIHTEICGFAAALGTDSGVAVHTTDNMISPLATAVATTLRKELISLFDRGTDLKESIHGMDSAARTAFIQLGLKPVLPDSASNQRSQTPMMLTSPPWWMLNKAGCRTSHLDHSEVQAAPSINKVGTVTVGREQARNLPAGSLSRQVVNSSSEPQLHYKPMSDGAQSATISPTISPTISSTAAALQSRFVHGKLISQRRPAQLEGTPLSCSSLRPLFGRLASAV